MADPVIGPNDPGGDPVPSPTPTPSSAPADLTALERINSLYSEIIGKQAIQKEEVTSYAKVIETINDRYDEMLALVTGLEGKDKAAAARFVRHVNDQKELFLLAERYFTTQRGITQEQEKQRDILKGIQRVGERMGLDQTQISAAKERFKDDLAISLIDKRITGWTAAIQKAGELVDIGFQSQMAGARGRAIGLMRGGGAAGLDVGINAGQDAAMRLFAATGTAMGPLERMTAFNRIMLESPRSFEKNEEKMKTLIGTMAYFGATTDQMVSTLITGSREANLTTTDVASAYRSASLMQKELGLSTMETANNLLNMTKVVRQSGGSLTTASAILGAFSKNVEGAGVALAPMEKLALAQKFASGVFNMPVDKLLGLTMYTSGKSLQSINAGDIGGGNALGIARTTWEKISQQVGNSYAEQLVATQKVAQLIGVNVSNLQEVEALQKILKDNNMSQDEAKKTLEAMSNPALVTAKGIENLEKTIAPLDRIDNNVKLMLAHLTGIGNSMSQAVQLLALLKLLGASGSTVGGVLSAAGAGSATASAARWIRRGWTASGAALSSEGGLAVLGTSIAELPVALVAGAAVGTGYLAYKGYQAMEKP